MSKKKSQGTHLETELGCWTSKAEDRLLKQVLPTIGFAFLKKARITDFVLPTRGKTTKRMRLERITRSADGSEGLHCLRCYKNHPIKGKKGKHVRKENEKVVRVQAAVSFVLSAIDELKAPIPLYRKTRWYFQGVYKGYEMTIALDRAHGLRKFSGYYMEIETILPLSEKGDVPHVLAVIGELQEELLGEQRPSKISYRKMLKKTWKSKKIKNGKKLREVKAEYRRLVKKINRKAKKSEKAA